MNTQDTIRAESHKDPAQLEREIDQKRGHIEDIVSALESKLSPGEIFDRMLSMGKGNGGQFASNLADTIKANPVPALLTATGLVWLYSGRNKSPNSSTSTYRSSSTSTSGLSGTSTSSMYATGSIDSNSNSGGKLDAARDKLDSAKEKVSSAGHRVSESTRNAAHSVSETTRNAASTVGEKARGAAGSVRSGAQRANEGLHRMLEENPMAVGALAIAAGAMLGAIIPTTRKENELMGPTSDRLTDKAKEKAMEAKEKAKEAARTGRESLAEATREVTSASKSDSNDSSSDQLSGSITSTTTVSTTTASTPQRPH
ncbi:DUF3618 domain-containing protein [Lysobacter korlensis]|uniref:DUF3618 domain-containing protein n=1 Tax=Lysobacter korlensis TaxID=553636 RepID=A0ABV6RPG6_9GAMM